MADLGNTSVISPTDASNGSGTMPSWLGSAAPSTLDDAGRALQGATAREWECRSYPTSTGTAPAFVVTMTVAPAALRSGQTYTFTAHAAAVGTDTLNPNTLGAKGVKKIVAGVKTATAANDWYIGDKIAIVYDGTDMVWSNWQGASNAATTSVSGIVELLTTAELMTGTDTTRAATAVAAAAIWKKGADVASSGTTLFLDDGGFVHITGTTTITDLDFTTATDGRTMKVIFDGILTLTHNSTTLKLPGGANITTAAGDRAEFVQDSGDNIICTWYTKASGTAVVVAASGMTLISTLTTTSGTTQSVTGIGVYRELYIELCAVSFTGNVTMTLAVSDDNGSNYGTARAISIATGTGSAVIYGTIRLSNIQTTDSLAFAHSLTALAATSTATLIDVCMAEAGGAPAIINAIQFAGGTFDAGTIRVYGIS